MLAQNWQFIVLLVAILGTWGALIMYIGTRIDRVHDKLDAKIDGLDLKMDGKVESLRAEIANIRDMLTGKVIELTDRVSAIEHKK